MLLSLALTVVVLHPTPSPQAERARAWSEDAAFLAGELERLHPEPFSSVPRAEFEAAVEAYLAHVESWTDEEAMAELLRLVALVSRGGQDGHTALWPEDGRYLPVQLYAFADGWYVVDASEPHAALVGRRLLALDGIPIQEACARLAPFLSHDNESNLRHRTGLALTLPALLCGAHLSPSCERTDLRLAAQDGTETVVALRPGPPADTRPWGGAFARSLPARGAALWLTERERAFWMRTLPEERALYVQYNAVLPRDQAGRTLADFAAELVRRFHEQDLERVLVDVRSNAGGDSSTFGPLVAALRDDPAINRRGTLFLLVGRATFSAGGNFAAELRRQTAVRLVGESPGGAPDHFGDAQEIVLPHHPAFHLRVSTLRHAYAADGASHLLLEPDVPVALTSRAYFAGEDPVLRAALDHREH